MPTTDRQHNEQRHHDEQALSRQRHFARQPDDLLVNDEAYLDHETWIRPAFAQLGDVRRQQVLDYGCGHGMAAVVLAKRGAFVTGFDLSAWYVAEATERARVNGVADQVRFLQAAAEQLPFADESFDAIWGNAILHHLDLDVAGSELARVLRPDGVAVFCEPWGDNPLLDWARKRLPYRGKDRSVDEQPLRSRDLPALARHFADIRLEPHQLLSMVRRAWPGLPFLRQVERWDASLLRSQQSLRRWCRYMVLSLRQPRRV